MSRQVQCIGRFKASSTSAKCGYALKKAAYVVKRQALRKKDMATKGNIDIFLELYEAEWSKKVTSHALKTCRIGNTTGRKSFRSPLTYSF